MRPPRFLYLAAYAEYIACPALRGCILLAESELGIVVEIDRDGPYAVGAVGAYLGHHALVYGAGEDEASVVVGVLADKVDAAGRGVELAFASEAVGESLADKINVHCNVDLSG